VTAYTTELSMPLVGMTAEAVLADRLAEDLHDRVLRAVLAAAPADRGWTSSFGPPERARPDGPTL
jgi:hypothetical protein